MRLRTYLITFSSSYESLSVYHLANIFDLSIPNVHSIVSKSVMNDELHVVFRNVEHSRVLVIVGSTVINQIKVC